MKASYCFLAKDGSRSLGLFSKGKTRIIAKFDRTDFVICNLCREGKMQSYSQINMVLLKSIISELSKQLVPCCILSLIMHEATEYCISSVVRMGFSHPNQSQKSRSVLFDGSRFLGLFRKGKPQFYS